VADDTAPPAPRTLDDPLEESLRIVRVAGERGLIVRLIGGMAIRAHSPAWPARTRRREADLDFVTTSKDRAAVYKLLEREGYKADKRHNALFGQRQAYFVDEARRRPVDVLVDRLEMCHVLEFGNRLALSRPTLPLADLLLTKLQIVKINRKDVLDALALLAEHPLADDDGDPDSDEGLGAINVRRIVGITSGDWGWWRTVTGNLDVLGTFLISDLQEGDLALEPDRPVRFDPVTQIGTLRAAIAAAPKTSRWRMRATVGERVRWYSEPEELAH